MPGLVVAALALAALAVAARGLERRTTWYLASDQFAFLTFASDLAHGRIFHDPAVVRLLSGRDTGPPGPADAYYQTYLWRDGRLYSRYPPGFPLLLAATGAVAGEGGRHALNPILYLLLLGVLGILVGWLMRPVLPAAAAGAGVTVIWLLLVLPTAIHQWGITVARDLPAHLLALVAILAASGGWIATAGFAMGYAASIRPDALLWAVAIAPVVCLRGARLPRLLARGSAAFLVGAAPLLAYNTVTQGHPLAFTQGSEFRDLFTAPRPFVAAGVTPWPGISGGAFRLSSIPVVLPLNARYLVEAFGALLVPAAGALAWALARRRSLAGAFGIYAPVGLLFYSCWGRPD